MENQRNNETADIHEIIVEEVTDQFCFDGEVRYKLNKLDYDIITAMIMMLPYIKLSKGVYAHRDRVSDTLDDHDGYIELDEYDDSYFIILTLAEWKYLTGSMKVVHINGDDPRRQS